MRKARELIICIITLTILMLTITSVFAAQPITDLNAIGGTNSTSNNVTNGNISTINQYVIENTNNTPVENSIQNFTINNTSNTSGSPNELADTGIESTSFFIIIICGISAIYAYKRIKDFRNI